ncbi:MAG: hypothetical protein GWN67_14865 [Phycisphaerae bacterium]|nr:hypothetical protein [Phycisphaerae bacterium]NIP52845.1 hypothetical protein [Phycisphaerae bacterium]NIS51866.1 hypothetical protein [Phycisphaerae bacterium]NIU09384.1 hypothetical protein [Phycisphaerae bacterium]NIU57617.1 hypothetical protein [Phycisphaerae bacterium]
MIEKEGANSGKDGPIDPKPETLAGFLAASLDMEDEISNGVYQDYMDPDNWPPGLDLNIFQEIRKDLTTLIEDTRRHRKIILGLIEKYGKDNTAG